MSQNPTDHIPEHVNLDSFGVEVLYEDNHLIAVNKPFGMLSQGDETGDISVFDWTKEYIRRKYQKPGEVFLGLLHRLDRPVGGLILFARTSKAASRVSDSFRRRLVQKTYLAITEGIPQPETGSLEHHLLQLPGKNIIRAYDQAVKGSKAARLDYQVIKKSQGLALIEVHPLTGRKHQIRVQLASKGTVIKGDVKYGKTSFNPDKSICLFSHQLQVPHPIRDKGPLTLQAPTPKTGVWKRFI